MTICSASTRHPPSRGWGRGRLLLLPRMSSKWRLCWLHGCLAKVRFEAVNRHNLQTTSDLKPEEFRLPGHHFVGAHVEASQGPNNTATPHT